MITKEDILVGKNIDLSTIQIALTRLWTEAPRARDPQHNLRNLATLLSSASHLGGMTGAFLTISPWAVLDIADVCDPDESAVLGAPNEAFFDRHFDSQLITSGAVVGYITVLRRYANAVRGRVGEAVADDNAWRTAVMGSVRRSYPMLLQDGEYGGVADIISLFARDLLNVLQPMGIPMPDLMD